MAGGLAGRTDEIFMFQLPLSYIRSIKTSVMMANYRKAKNCNIFVFTGSSASRMKIKSIRKINYFFPLIKDG